MTAAEVRGAIGCKGSEHLVAKGRFPTMGLSAAAPIEGRRTFLTQIAAPNACDTRPDGGPI